MGRTVASMVRVGAALGVALAGAAGASAQVPTVSIEDMRVVEGSGGPWDRLVTVTLSAPTSSTVSVPWSTVPGSATAGVDYGPNASTVTFPPFSTTQEFPVSIVGDTVDEWSPRPNTDEVFFIDLDVPTTGNATLLKSRASVTIVDDDRAYPGLQLVSAVADGNPVSGGRVRLQWRVPPASAVSGPVTDVLVRWNAGAGCAAPADAGAPATGQFWLSVRGVPVKQPGETQVVEHAPLPFVQHCYALFAVYSAPTTTPTTERATVVATPFDSAAPNLVAWAYSVAGSFPSVVPPTVGLDAVYTVSTDGVVHAMERGEAGGAWPAPWNPVGLGKPAHNRSPVVPLAYGSRLFVGTESGEVHSVDAGNGAIAWSRSQAFNDTQLSPLLAGAVQGTPAGLFTAFAGQNDLILVGTNFGTSDNTFYMLDPVKGGNAGPIYSHGAMGGVPGMGVVDYLSNRVYFLTTSTSGTLWAFDLGVPGSPGLTPSALAGGNPVPLPGSGTSPVLRNGRLYFGTTNGDVVVRRVFDGAMPAINLSDGQVKGFIFPDRRNGDLYLSTNTRVWAVSDTIEPSAPNLFPRWFVDDIPSPSIVLHWPNTNFLYVGGGDGRLYQIDVSSADPKGTKKSVLLEPGSQVGAPSLDGPRSLVLVGSATGVVYAVRVPLP